MFGFVEIVVGDMKKKTILNIVHSIPQSTKVNDEWIDYEAFDNIIAND